MNEIAIGSNHQSTCERYDCIKNNRPNLLFMHYKKNNSNKLQKFRAKYLCPQITQEVGVNIASDRKGSIPMVLWDPKNSCNLLVGLNDSNKNTFCHRTTTK